MHTFLVVIALWQMAYRGNMSTPAYVVELPNRATCEAAGQAVVRLAAQGSWQGAKFECVDERQ